MNMDNAVFQNINVLSEQVDQYPGELAVTCLLSPDDPVFQGHFPDKPILAGAFQLYLAIHYLNKLLGLDLSIRQIKKARFKELIVPEEPFTLVLKVLSGLETDGYKVSVKIIKDKKTITNVTLFVK